MNLKHNRYSFWKVFWIVAATNILLIIIAVITMSVSLMPSSSENFSLKSFFNWTSLFKLAGDILFLTLFLYFTVNMYFQLIVERKHFVDYLKVSVLAIIACFVHSELSNYVFPYKTSATDKMPAGVLTFSFFMSSLFLIGLSLVISYLTSLHDEKKQRQILEEQKMQLEIEKSHANLNFLKAQINPHFLHNTLNFLYAKSLPCSPELSEGILTLSEIMRYALSEGNAKDGKALLKDEIEHVRNVIKINQLRFSNNLKVNFDVNGVINGATIIPFVLITIVENAFKHGNLKSTEYPININISVAHNALYFYCRNEKKTGPKELSTGLGLNNIKKRLDLAYGNNYILNIKDEADFYTTELTINSL
jgi:two-component system LytT family sensor kinase